MLEDFFSVVLLVITSVIAIGLSLSLFWNYIVYKKIYHFLWGISLFVLAIFGLIIVYHDFSIMTEPVVHIITTLIPLCLALGIVYAFWGEENTYVYLFALYEVVTLSILGIVELLAIADMSLVATLLTHVPAGLVMFFVPIIAYLMKDVDISALLFSVGTAFIGSIGLLFAFVKLNIPVLNYNEILIILPLAYMMSAIFLTLGMILPKKWKFKIFPSSL